MIRVLIADDHPVYVDGIAAAIERASDLELTAAVGDAATALRHIRADPPDVAVLDLRMPGMTTEAALAELAGDELGVAVLILSVHVGGPEVHECLSLGAAGYVAKDADRAEICEAIRDVARGRSALSTAAQTSMASELRDRRDRAHPLLSPREHEILGLLATGASTPAIAERLFLSPATVKTHLHHLYEKLEVSDRAAAVAEGLRRGLIS